MATHSSTLAWKIPRMEVRGRLHKARGVTKSPRLSNFTFTLTIFLMLIHLHELLIFLAFWSCFLIQMIGSLEE